MIFILFYFILFEIKVAVDVFTWIEYIVERCHDATVGCITGGGWGGGDDHICCCYRCAENCWCQMNRSSGRWGRRGEWGERRASAGHQLTAATRHQIAGETVAAVCVIKSCLHHHILMIWIYLLLLRLMMMMKMTLIIKQLLIDGHMRWCRCCRPPSAFWWLFTTAMIIGSISTTATAISSRRIGNFRFGSLVPGSSILKPYLFK